MSDIYNLSFINGPVYNPTLLTGLCDKIIQMINFFSSQNTSLDCKFSCLDFKRYFVELFWLGGSNVQRNCTMLELQELAEQSISRLTENESATVFC